MALNDQGLVMDVTPWPKGHGFTGSDAWWQYMLSKDERRRLDNLMGVALLDEEIRGRLVEQRGRQYPEVGFGVPWGQILLISLSAYVAAVLLTAYALVGFATLHVLTSRAASRAACPGVWATIGAGLVRPRDQRGSRLANPRPSIDAGRLFHRWGAFPAPRSST